MVKERVELHAHTKPRKGPFWLAEDKIIAFPVDLTVMPVPSHKKVWANIKCEINEEWNYYPRGRVEIRNEKAIVFLSPYCYEYTQLENDLRQLFFLGNMKIIWKTDNSAHYIPGMLQSSCRRRK